MTDTITHHFTFGQAHMTSFPLPEGGRLADYWVSVTLPTTTEESHRAVFIREFMEKYCPNPAQFAFEYDDDKFERKWFPNGQLCLITSNGIENE